MINLLKGVKRMINFRILVIAMMFFSCSRYELSNEDIQWQPYKIGDILVFESNRGEKDIIKIENIQIQNNADDPLAIFPNMKQTLFVGGNKNVLELNAGKKGNNISFELRLGESYMRYPCFYVYLDEIEKKRESVCPFEEFKNCFSFKVKELCDNMKDRPFDLRYIYWSKEYGYLGLEFKDNYVWTLKSFVRGGKEIL